MPRERVQARYDKKFQKLLSGAAKVFFEKGYGRASIRDVAREIGMSVSSLYYYVDGKEEILFHIQKHVFLQVLESLEQKWAGVEDPEKKLALLIENHISFFVENMREMKVLSHEGETLTGGYYREIALLKREYVRRASGTIAAILKRKKSKNPDPGTAALCLFGMMNWIYNWYDPKRDGGSRELAKTMQQLFFKGLRD